ncbi:MAG: hypothetical protein J7M14_03275 [Planctomycetes bacterium]|nr:hypothetical protein [Planctomycetota bacterium]
MTMTGRERVLAVLNHERPDCIPFDIGGTDCSSVHVLAYKKLRGLLGLVNQPVSCIATRQLVAELDDDVRNVLGIDTEPLPFAPRETWVWSAPFDVSIELPVGFRIEDFSDGSAVYRNDQGIVVGRKPADYYYFDPVSELLAEISSPNELDKFDGLFERWDYPGYFDESLDELADRARRRYASTDRAVVALWRLHYLQAGQLMRGYEQFLIDLMVDKPMAHAIFEKLHEVYMRRVETFLGAFADAFDVVLLTDDLGSQVSGLISPAVYEEMLYPYFRELVAGIKSAGKKVLLHSCGAVAGFIPKMIEAGVDALNPVQVSASRMNPAGLVREFGKDIAFWGGGCDTQNAMNAPDTETVRTDVRRRLDEFGSDAALVFTQVHNIQYDVPAENILAMRDEFFKQTR